MTTYTSIAEAPWPAEEAWSPVGVPGAEDHVIIQDYKITVGFAPCVAGSLEVKSGQLYLNNQYLTVGGNCIFHPDAIVGYAGPTVDEGLNVGGDCYIRQSNNALAFGGLVVSGRLRGIAAKITNTVVTLSQPGLMVGGALFGVDASGGERVMAYGCDDNGRC